MQVSFRRRRVIGASVLSAVDVVVQRAVSSLVVLVMAVFTNPSVVGLVSASTLLLTFYQAVFESPVRQSGYRAIEGTSSDRASLGRVLRIGGILGGISVSLAIYGVLLWQGASGWEFSLLFYGLVPLIISSYLISLLCAQSNGLWARIVLYRTVSVLSSALVSVPILVFFDPVVAVVLQAVVSELVFAALLVVSQGRSAKFQSPGHLSGGYMKDLRQTSVLSLFGWLRGQSDRLWVLVIGGATVLGIYSVAYALARSASDAALVGLTNLYRLGLAKAGFTTPAIQRQLRAQVVRVMVLSWLCLCMAVVTAVCVEYFWRSPSWSGSSRIVPILAFSVFASSVSWSINATLNHTGESRSLYWIQWLEMSLAVVVGILLAHSIFVGAIAVCVREFVGSLLGALAARRYLQARVLFIWLVNCGAGGIACGSATWFLLEM